VNGGARLEERIVVLAPSAHDGSVATNVLARAGFTCAIARDATELCRLLEEGAAAALVAEEALTPDAAHLLGELVRRQEPWSDLPIILFMSGRAARAGRLSTIEVLAPFGNVTLLDRPLEVITLVSAVRAAHRARLRQYATRAVLVELEATVTEQHRLQEELRSSEARFRVMADGTPLILWVTDAAGGIEFVNRAYCEFFGTTLEEVRARGWHPLVHPEDAPAYVDAYARAAAERKPFHAEARVRRADGAWRWVESRGAPRFSATGDFLGLVGSSPDITERKQAEAELRDADRQKTEFLGVLSHELRNPLAPIRNSAFLLAHAPPASEQAIRARKVIERQAAHLARLVDDLLDVTRIVRRKIELRRSRVDAREVVARTCEDHRSLFETRGIELDVRSSRPTWVDADRTRLAQMVGNLLQNAAKFSSQGDTVSVTVTATGSVARISVCDDGIGIAPELLPRLFHPFVQAGGGLSRALGGLGLGLSLVKELAELHGGTVRARSEGLGKGAEFVIELPLSARPAESASEPRPRTHRRSLRVLVVDDNVDSGRTLADLLELEGHSALVAMDGRGGLETAREQRPDVVICDIGLPDIDGYEVARAVRGDPSLASTRLVALSGYAQPEDRQRALDAGFDAHIAKPLAPDGLLGALDAGYEAGAGDAEREASESFSTPRDQGVDPRL
jgi:PAS domain S-box-containing protein